MMVLRHHTVIPFSEAVARVTEKKYNGSRVVVILGPGDTVGVRDEFSQHTLYAPVRVVLELIKRLNFRKGKL